MMINLVVSLVKVMVLLRMQMQMQGKEKNPLKMASVHRPHQNRIKNVPVLNNSSNNNKTTRKTLAQWTRLALESPMRRC